MKLWFSVVVLALCLIPASAHAQVGVYINPVAARISTSTADSGTFAFLGDGNKSAWFEGVNIGGFYDRYHGKSVDVGFDVRDTYMGSNNARLNDFLVGARVVAKNLSPMWRPYVQLSGGAGTTRAPHSTIKTTRATWAVFAGADYKLSRVVNIRAFEVGYGSLTTISSATVGSAATSLPSSKMLQVSAGLVFRFK
ncbi:MAG: outer membrane beta-barrel protein [Edaphobacter sp.]|uniref:outer membrane beta-barrel protein n=1 Tax=Edaphobacter sp. TaxID=1934404 RepID=UPI0023A3A0F5|nr:outer membrane beta-barrel protein [Edaphobacter sp.]MDE1178306.1 outer membrane beta-barrel protein [Edaphobacter sp.]